MSLSGNRCDSINNVIRRYADFKLKGKRKMIKLITSLLIVLGIVLSGVIGISAYPVGPNGELDFSDRVWLVWNGKKASASLSGTRYQKKVTACVGTCSTSGWVSANTFTAYIEDIGPFTATAYTYYEYK